MTANPIFSKESNWCLSCSVRRDEGRERRFIQPNLMYTVNRAMINWILFLLAALLLRGPIVSFRIRIKATTFVMKFCIKQYFVMVVKPLE